MGIASRLAQTAINQHFINQQNRYNSPVAQMGRLKRAGLNPALLYNNIQPDVQANPNQYPDSRIAEDIEAYKARKMQEKLQEKEEAKKEEETRTLKLSNDIQETLQKYINQYPDEYYTPQVFQFLDNARKLEEEIRRSQTDEDREKRLLELQELLNDANVQKLLKEVDNIQKNMDLTDKQIERLNKELNNWDAMYLQEKMPWYAHVLIAFAEKFGINMQSIVDGLKKFMGKTQETGKSVVDKYHRWRYGITVDDAKKLQNTYGRSANGLPLYRNTETNELYEYDEKKQKFYKIN